MRCVDVGVLWASKVRRVGACARGAGAGGGVDLRGVGGRAGDVCDGPVMVMTGWRWTVSQRQSTKVLGSAPQKPSWAAVRHHGRLFSGLAPIRPRSRCATHRAPHRGRPLCAAMPRGRRLKWLAISFAGGAREAIPRPGASRPAGRRVGVGRRTARPEWRCAP